MVQILPLSKYTVENTVFGVWKTVGRTNRLIRGGERANKLFNPLASSVELSMPDIVSLLRLPAGERLFLAGVDILQFFNWLRFPLFLFPLFGTPGISASLVKISLSCELVVSCITSFPKGATFAASLTKEISLAILSRSSLTRLPLSASDYGRALPRGDGVQLPSIDDLSSTGCSADGVNAATDRILDSLRDSRIPVEDGKAIVVQHHTSIEALGVWWLQAGVLNINPATAARLFI